ncbi:RNA polymerase sigma factor [Paenibacillus taiwanensis]|uniref:RNA polymerase sigma factor n=1 Tax=Paenibacillus taiwanensis TaxID=401638 RepID=UPI00041E8690|nr:sigma-70 family RNA polymerase sigma factor [Paenibacillus taiwanensis]
MSRHQTEDDIIASILAGKPERFADLINKYKQNVYGILIGMGASHEDAQDTAQEAFIKAYRKLSSHEKGKSFAAWLYTIVVRTYRDRFKRKAFMLIELDTEQMIEEDTPELIYLKAESKEAIQRLVGELPDVQRLVLLLRYTEELTYEEMCEVTGLSVHQVKNALYRGKKALKYRIEQKGASSYVCGMHQSGTYGTINDH